MVALTEADDEDLAYEQSPNNGAKPSASLGHDEHFSEPIDSDNENEHAVEVSDDNDGDDDAMHDIRKLSATPDSSPPPGLHESVLEGTYIPEPAADSDPVPPVKTTKTLTIPKISLPPPSGSRTPHESASTPAESAVPTLLNPEDDLLSDSDLPDPWIEDAPRPIQAECEDRADYLLQTRFKPMADVQDVIAALTKYPISQRSTESLFALAENAQHILKEWQDQYLMLDARVRSRFSDPYHIR
jgi:hypothetical protein